MASSKGGDHGLDRASAPDDRRSKAPTRRPGRSISGGAAVCRGRVSHLDRRRYRLTHRRIEALAARNLPVADSRWSVGRLNLGERGTATHITGRHMKIIEIDMGFGARVEDVDMNALTQGEVDRLRTALLDRGMLVIPGQALSPVEKVRMSEVFGALETFPPAAGQLTDFPQIFRVASRSAEGHTTVGRYWHSDGSFRPEGTPISIWYLVVQPEECGETLFTDLREAYRAFPDDAKASIEHLITVHRNGVMHPLVIRHPATHHPSLYFNVGLTGRVIGLANEDFAALRVALDDHLSRAGATYVHHWRAGDVVIADNFRGAHRATPIAATQHRVLDRTTIRADGVYWNDASARALAQTQ